MGDTEKNALKMAAGVTAATIAVHKLVAAYNQFTKQNLAVYAHFEQMELGLSAMTGSAEKGKALFEELRTFSNKTTFGVDTLANATTQLLALGVAEDEVKDKLTQLGNIAGGSTEKFNRLVDVFVKIGAVGRASGIQLNQLSMITGVSWRKIMADMGVAKPTFEDISRAFEKLTEEGGKFHGRMDAIIDTIEGKEGFIRDTADELRALFADITGQAERYKARLDLVYDIQYGVLQIFKDISNNEAAKNIISGVYTSGLILISTTISVMLVPAIIKTATSIKMVTAALKVMKAAFPTALLIGAAVTAIAGIVMAIRDATKETREFNRELKELESQMAEMSDLKGNESLSEKGRYWTERADVYGSAVKSIKAEIERLNALNVDGNRSLAVERLEEKLKDYEYELYVAKNTAEAYKSLSDAEKKAAEDAAQAEQKRLESLKALGAELDRTRDLINNAFGMSDEGKNALRVEELQGMASALQNLLDINGTMQPGKDGVLSLFSLSDTEITRIQAGLDNIKNAIADILNPKEEPTIIELIEDRIKALYANTRQGRIEALQGEISRLESYQRSLPHGILGKENDQINIILNDLRAKLEKEQEALEKSTEAIEKVPNAVQSLREWIGELKQSGNLGMAAGMGMETVMNRSGNVSDFMQGMQMGGPWAGIINAVLGAFMDIAQEVEGFDMVMEPLNDLMERFKPTIEVIVGVIGRMNERINNSVQPFIDIINELMEALEPILETISTTSHILGVLLRGIGQVAKVIINAVMPAIKGFAAIMDFLFGWLEDWFGSTGKKEEEESETEILRQLNDEYKDLLDNIRKNNEYYQKRKMELEADTYSRKALEVNDMILTPQGRFSTNPQDTIIAMKHPEQLSSGAKVTINNYSGSEVDVQQNSLGELIINISKRVASDVASGRNGWDSALAQRQLRLGGRRVTA